MSTNACINEIFSSLQGEGTHVGERMTFVRFATCTLGCMWCDTDHNPNRLCSVHSRDTDEEPRLLPNPVGIVELNDAIEAFDDPTIAITGGEPLEQAEFLVEFLPQMGRRRKVLLETNGVHSSALSRVIEWVDIVSMDVKLPSSTGQRAYWDEHQAFIESALQSKRELYIKLVVTSSTTDKDVNEAIKLISKNNRYIPVILQPVTPTEVFSGEISEERLLSFKRLFSAWLPNVKIVPQMHREWGVQ